MHGLHEFGLGGREGGGHGEFLWGGISANKVQAPRAHPCIGPESAEHKNVMIENFYAAGSAQYVREFRFIGHDLEDSPRILDCLIRCSQWANDSPPQGPTKSTRFHKLS